MAFQPKDNGGQAFPIPESDTDYGSSGMTLRQWYAHGALIPFMQWKLAQHKDDVCYDAESAAKHYAKVAYLIADAMIEEGKE